MEDVTLRELLIHEALSEDIEVLVKALFTVDDMWNGLCSADEAKAAVAKALEAYREDRELFCG